MKHLILALQAAALVASLAACKKDDASQARGDDPWGCAGAYHTGLSSGGLAGTADCALDWNCRAKTVQVRCKHHHLATTGRVPSAEEFDTAAPYVCTCSEEGGEETATFALASACIATEEEEAAAGESNVFPYRGRLAEAANAACGWSLPVE